MTTSVFVLLVLLLGCGPRSEAPVPDYRVATDAVREGPFTNRLVVATSPYLLDHAHDPVDWHPWGLEAFEEARRRDVPVFLSIGYAACHWCHVMHDESFADPAVAALLNEAFVPVKVDREERPEVDALYLDALVRIAGDAGWPANLWVTPDGRPFHGGTYFPPEARFGRPAFASVLADVRQRWTTDRPGIEAEAARIEAGLRSTAVPAAASDAFPADAPARGTAQLSVRWDAEFAGWGRQKFPQVPALEHLLAYGLAYGDSASLEKVWFALATMDRGGIHDQLGGGFHRYTVDREWTTPHFEKMASDNALLLRLYAEAGATIDEPHFVRVADTTAAFLLDSLRLPDGTFATSLDATDPNGEGAFYTWTREEIAAVLPPDRLGPFLAAYPTPEGAERTRHALIRGPGDPTEALLVADRQALLATRALRPPPRRDEQRVVAWNALCVSALARYGRLLDHPDAVAAAARTALVLLAVRGADGALPHTLEPGSAPGVLDDYAFLAEALVDLYQADADPQWLVAADALLGTLRDRFGDPDGGGLWTTDAPTAPLGLRVQDWSDGPTPSGAGRALLAWAHLSGYGAPHADAAGLSRALRAAGGVLAESPGGASSLLLVVEGLSPSGVQAVVAASTDEAAAPFVRAFDATWRPAAVLAVVDPGDTALAPFGTLRDKAAGVDGARGYVCFDGVCRQPTADPEVFRAILDAPRALEERTPVAIP